LWQAEPGKDENSKILYGRIVIYGILLARMDFSYTSCVYKKNHVLEYVKTAKGNTWSGLTVKNA
jgi:hypothetical protein